jgi:hypothetical protein
MLAVNGSFGPVLKRRSMVRQHSRRIFNAHEHSFAARRAKIILAAGFRVAQPDLIGVEDEDAVIAERDLLEQKLPGEKVDAMASVVRWGRSVASWDPKASDGGRRGERRVVPGSRAA